MLRHLPVGVHHRGIRYQLLHMVGNFLNILHAVVYIVNLTAPGQLAVHRLTDHLIVVLHDIGLDRDTVHRRLLQHAHIADAHQTHMKGPRDRCCRQSQHIHIFLHLLDLLLVNHTKTLLLVNDQKPKILKLHILGKNTVGANHNVHLPFL